jgi:hypothetical protein
MRNILIATVAVVGLGLALPASAEDFYVGGGGVGIGVDVDGPGYHRDGYRDRDYDRGDRVYRRTEGFDRYESAERCRTTIIRRDDGSVKKIRRCRD